MARLMLVEAGRLIDGTGARPIESARMIVEDGLIREVGPASQVRTPNGDAERLDFSDYTVMPGLLDGHVHLVFSAASTALNDIIAENNQRIMLRAVHNAQLAL